MKILFISFYFKPDLSAGSFRSQALANMLLEQLPSGSQIQVITSLPNRYKSFLIEAPQVEIQPRLIIHRIRLPRHRNGIVDQAIAFIYFAKQTLNICKREKYDLIFATSSRLMTAALGAYVSKKKKIPLYLDIRDIFVDTINDVFSKKILWLIEPLFTFVENWAIRSAVRINLVSAGFLDYFKFRYPDKNFVFFTNGIDDEFLKAQPKAVYKNYSKTINILYAGNFGEGQGLDLIIPKLAKRLSKRVNFKVIGDGGRRQHLIAALKEIGCSNVQVLPPVSRQKLIEAYQEADILFLHLNDLDAFKKVLPSKIFEYAAMGKPIWGGVSGYAAKFMEENISNARIFPPCNIDQAIRAFDSLELVTQPRSAFVERFSRARIMKTMADDVISICQKMN